MKKEEKKLFNIFLKYGSKMNCNQALSKSILNTAKENRILAPLLKMYPNNIFEGINWEYKSELIRKSKNEFFQALDLFKKNNIVFLIIKGLIVENNYYPKDLIRESNDYDLIAKNVENYMIMAKLLIEKGYNFTYMPMFTSCDGQIVGVSKFEKEIDYNTKVKIEINIGGFPIGKYKWFISESLWERTKNINIYNNYYLIPDINMSLVIFLFEICSRNKLLIRDFIDFHYLYKNEIDWEVISSNINDKHVFKILKYFKKTYNKKEPKLKKFKNNLFLVFPHLLKTKKLKTISVYYTTLFLDKLVEKDLLLSLIKKVDKRISTYERFKLGIITYFIPVDYSIIGDFEWVKSSDYNYLVKTYMGIFLASNFCLHDPEEFEHINYLLGRSYGGD